MASDAENASANETNPANNETSSKVVTVLNEQEKESFIQAEEHFNKSRFDCKKSQIHLKPKVLGPKLNKILIFNKNKPA